VTRDATPEVRAAVVKGAMAEGVLLAVAVVLYLVFDQLWILFAAAGLGAAIMLFLIFQARASNDR
jgi:hypothetical protein